MGPEKWWKFLANWWKSFSNCADLCTIIIVYLCLPLYQFLNHLRGQVAQAPLHWQPSPYLGLLQRFHSLLQTPASFRPSCIYPNPAMSCGLLWHNQVLEGCPECFLESYLVYFWKLAEILLPSHFLALNWKEPPPWMRRSCTSLWQGGIPVVVALRACISIHVWSFCRTAGLYHSGWFLAAFSKCV